MGCDIHTYIEKLITIYKSNHSKWVNVDNWRFNPYFNENDPEGEEKLTICSIYRDRNYGLFSILANVRNYSDQPYISQPKGLPVDISKVTRDEAIRWGEDGHSFSYFTLQELKTEREKYKVIKHSGFISPEVSINLDSGIKPQTWCQGTSNESWVHRAWEDGSDSFELLIRGLEQRKKEEFWDFKKEETSKNDEKIRIVFWFDN